MLSITGCRDVEIQNVKLTDISKKMSSDGEMFYSIRVNLAKKRSNICIREVVISKSEFNSIISLSRKSKFHPRLSARLPREIEYGGSRYTNVELTFSRLGSAAKNLKISRDVNIALSSISLNLDL
ncbi:hypothetical protein A7978_05760 (plasmid) [Borrelia turicatae]|uniref:Uncharacterized protein n=1 Tax=Borrelia turicatae TaxID=142 RepID=A0A172XCZ2_BORTU|nr:hypothetical protein [Borrelia turicatae]ANF34544.1 hypothetical protein A7978_05760 [Borrelia turicatae]UPA15640.1 hypothetical protein btBTE5EL_001343 [Borrelia turicatae]